jgi:hypothetical protein
MHIGNLQSAGGRLQEAVEQLQFAWGATAEYWRDANAAEFEEQHLRAVFEEFQAVMPAVSQLTQVIQAAVRELEER